MSHEMVGFNTEGEEIAYVRFTMGDLNAHLLYDILDANEHNGGVSGKGASESYSLSQVEAAYNSYNDLNNNVKSSNGQNEFLTWQQKEISKFFNSCINTAQKEKIVTICFC